MATFAQAVTEKDRLQGSFVGVSARIALVGAAWRVAVHDARPSSLKDSTLKSALATTKPAGTDGGFVGWSEPLEPSAWALVY